MAELIFCGGAAAAEVVVQPPENPALQLSNTFLSHPALPEAILVPIDFYFSIFGPSLWTSSLRDNRQYFPATCVHVHLQIS